MIPAIVAVILVALICPHAVNRLAVVVLLFAQVIVTVILVALIWIPAVNRLAAIACMNRLDLIVMVLIIVQIIISAIMINTPASLPAAEAAVLGGKSAAI